MVQIVLILDCVLATIGPYIASLLLSKNMVCIDVHYTSIFMTIEFHMSFVQFMSYTRVHWRSLTTTMMCQLPTTKCNDDFMDQSQGAYLLYGDNNMKVELLSNSWLH